LGALYVVGVVYGMMAIVLRPPSAPDVPEQPARPRLAQHVLFVVVDGLRFDVANDPARMPHFAEAMRERHSAQILAGKISMTSAAVQNYGTGQRGRLVQIVRNINPEPPPYDSWLRTAARNGRVLGLVGDPVWVEMFGPAFRYKLLDPPGVAMDYDFNEQTFRDARTLIAKAPDLAVVHFVTPDHQGHVHGIPSERYRRHIHDFDARLFELLHELPPDWTVLVTSDHGAADSGTHGADVPVQRRSPLFAYGPGISKKQPSETLDQSDLANTLAALLGVPAALHSQGHLLTGWLDVPEAVRADYACSDAERALQVARADGAVRTDELATELARGCAESIPPEQRRARAAALVRRVDDALSRAHGVASPQAWAFLGVTLLSAALIGWLLAGQSVRAGLVCALLGLVAIALVAGLEHLPGGWPKRVDAACFVVFNLPSLLFLLKPERLVRLLDEKLTLAAAIVPGGFAVTYPTNLQPVAFAICLVAPLVIVFGQRADAWGLSWRRDEARKRLLDLALLVGWGSALAPAGIWASGAYSNLAQQRLRVLGLGLALLGSVAFVLARSTPRVWRSFVGFWALWAAALVLRRFAPAWLGQPLLVALPLVGVAFVLRRQVELGLALVLTGIVWAARDFEVLPLAAGTGVALLLGERLAGVPSAAWTRGRWLLSAGILFVLMFLVRLGMSAGLDVLGLDFTAGAFGDKHVSATWITLALLWKYLLVAVLLMLGLLRGVPRWVAERCVVALVVVGVCRAAVLVGMMQCAQGSFWTAMRVLSDLPFALLFAVAAALVLPWTGWRFKAHDATARVTS
jgi:hypothetical protein